MSVIPGIVSNFFNLKQKALVREVNAAVINISGRQRMLSQRAALYALRFVHQPSPDVCQELINVVDCMARSHRGLIYGDTTLKLPGKVSPTVHRILFAPPYELDAQVHQFVSAARQLAETSAPTLDDPNLQHLLTASANRLLSSLDHLVNQYQAEADAQTAAIDEYQANLYAQATAAQEQAQSHAQSLQATLTQLQTTQQQLVHAEKMSSLGQLVAGIAHEINNPLSFIYGNLSYVQDYAEQLMAEIQSSAQATPERSSESVAELDFIQTDLPRLLQSMELGAQRIKAIVEGLRSFARLDEDSLKSVSLQDGLESTLLMLHHTLQGSAQYPSIRVQRHYTPEALDIECYPGQLNQVFMNLCRNAIEALHEAAAQRPQGWHPELIIETRHLKENWVQIKIIDNGLGIPEAIQSRIFDPFFTTKPVGSGTGLGLAISHQIVVDVHQGELVCTSNPEAGTTFTLKLPTKANSQHYQNVISWPKKKQTQIGPVLQGDTSSLSCVNC
ncbi:MAG: histidine kinase [Spirulina sp. SIO3F2]|nr:histidine kinase [Spirulina sp. SIO3F2]